MADKYPVQASRGGKVVHGDGVSSKPSGRDSRGESGGGAYPNPHRGKKPKTSPGDFMDHGGQTEIAYHGSGQLGEEDVNGLQSARKPASDR
ncbi:hypothetical protein [Flavisphingomonas formosensis]|uniref:hypothetical protein n=1 Tax=Flavisphingomonas formosensis TaxID=861534 RepID=UPI0012F9D64B|nr:hypothetical protein [Sphingomonas formosensis]